MQLHSSSPVAPRTGAGGGGDITNSIKVGITSSPQILRDKKPTDQLTKSSLTHQFITQHPSTSSFSSSSSPSFIPHHRHDHKQHFQHFHHYSPHHRHTHHYSSSSSSSPSSSSSYPHYSPSSSSSAHFLPSSIPASSSSFNEKLNHQTTLPIPHESLLIHEPKSNLNHHNLMMNDEVKATTSTATATKTTHHLPVTAAIEVFPFSDNKMLLPVSTLTPNNFTQQQEHQHINIDAYHLNHHHFDTSGESNLLINSQLIKSSPEPASSYSSYSTSTASSSNLASASMLSSPLCPSLCQCKWRSGKKTVLCVAASLTVVPDSIESDTQVLNLNENDLDDFLTKPSTSFSSLGLTNLQRIYLSR